MFQIPSRPLRGLNRCPRSGLTPHQMHALAGICLGHPFKVPHGAIRALVIRGLLTGKHEITQIGRAALDACEFLSPKFRAALMTVRVRNGNGPGD